MAARTNEEGLSRLHATRPSDPDLDTPNMYPPQRAVNGKTNDLPPVRVVAMLRAPDHPTTKSEER